MTDQPYAAQPEYLGDEPTPAEGRARRRGPLVAATAVGVVGVVALGGWAALSLMADGDQPSVAVPADALAYLSVDLDPSAGQKLEALQIVEKFPALDEQLGLDADDDLRRWIFDESGLAECDGVTYDDDVAPWIGSRAAVAVLPGGGNDGEPAPVFTLQVADEAAAEEKLGLLLRCDAVAGESAAGTQGGFAVGNGHAVLAETTKVAEATLAAAAKSSLADTDAFRRWTGEVGDPGIVTAYVAPHAPARLLELAEEMSGGAFGIPPGTSLEYDGTEASSAGLGPDDSVDGDQLEAVRKMTREFQGMAAVLRFEDGAVEVEMASGGLPKGSTPAADATSVTELPASTGVALSMAFPDGWLTDYLDTVSALEGGVPVDRMLAEAERATGLALPEDAETLVGDDLSIALDSGLDVSDLEARGPASVPAGVRITGDPGEIVPIIDKLKAKAGPEADMVVVETADGTTAVGLDPDYVAQLASDGALGEDEAFSSAVPEADRAGAVFYVSFDAGDGWVTRVAEEMSAGFEGGRPDPQIRRNLEALDALGVSSWVDDDVARGLVRLTTD